MIHTVIDTKVYPMVYVLLTVLKNVKMKDICS